MKDLTTKIANTIVINRCKEIFLNVVTYLDISNVAEYTGHSFPRPFGTIVANTACSGFQDS